MGSAWKSVWQAITTAIGIVPAILAPLVGALSATITRPPPGPTVLTAKMGTPLCIIP